MSTQTPKAAGQAAYCVHRTFAANVDHATERKAFERWYVENAFDYERNPIGSEQCADEWRGWLGRAALVEPAQQPADFWKSFLDAVWWEFEEGERRTVPCNAPGHDHETIGIWDADNGELAGKPCDWCKTWNAAVALVDGKVNSKAGHDSDKA